MSYSNCVYLCGTSKNAAEFMYLCGTNMYREIEIHSYRMHWTDNQTVSSGQTPINFRTIDLYTSAGMAFLFAQWQTWHVQLSFGISNLSHLQLTTSSTDIATSASSLGCFSVVLHPPIVQIYPMHYQCFRGCTPIRMMACKANLYSIIITSSYTHIHQLHNSDTCRE